MEELWSQPIEDNYLVSNFGKVFSIKRGIIMKTRYDKQGYEVLVLHSNTGAVNRSVHRLVALAFIPNALNLPQVNHIDGNKSNNFVNNLEWVSASVNNQHAFDLGLRKSGENHYKAKLTESDVKDIKYLLTQGVPQRAISKYFPVGRSTIAKIANNQIWKQLTEEA
jgi:hypothetical protein